MNIGRGEGVSVRELIDIVLEVTGRKDVEPVIMPRRAGDPASVVASSELIRRELDWAATRGVREMVESAWEGWCLNHPQVRGA